MVAHGWMKVTEYQQMAVDLNPGEGYSPGASAQVFATLALSEAIMAASSDVCNKLEGIRWALEQLYAAVSSLPGAS